jgi:drug/metabolite transporter (DMT)-like permease
MMENLRGALLMILAMVCFAIEDMFVKLLADRLAVGEILIIFALGGGAIFAAAAIWRGDGLWSRDLLAGSVIGRNLGEIIGTIGYMLAVVFTPLATASAILQATPLAVTLGAAVFLKESVGWRRWTAISVGFIGVLIVIQPGGDAFDPLSVLAVIGVIGLAARDVVTRRVPKTISSMQLSAYGFLILAPAGWILMAVMGDTFIGPAAKEWLWISGGIAFGVVGYYALIAAMRIGEASFITPFRYMRLLIAIAISALVFGEPATMWTLIGGTVIVGSGLYTLLREQRVKRRAVRAAKQAALEAAGPLI